MATQSFYLYHLTLLHENQHKQTYSVARVHKRTIAIEEPLIVNEDSANFYG
jgi:hypothetical protein